MSQFKKDDLFMIKDIVESQANNLHFVQEEERKLRKLKNKRVKAKYSKDIDDFLTFLEATTRAAPIVDMKKQKEVRQFLLEIIGWLVHQDNVQILFPDIYSATATTKLKELFMSLFPYQFDAHEIITRSQMDNLLGMISKVTSASAPLFSRFNRIPDSPGALRKIKSGIVKKATGNDKSKMSYESLMEKEEAEDEDYEGDED